MKKIIITIIAFVSLANLNGQQVPISENYFMDKASISPSYAGHFNPGTLFTSLGQIGQVLKVDQNLKLSYSDKIMDNAAYGARILAISPVFSGNCTLCNIFLQGGIRIGTYRFDGSR